MAIGKISGPMLQTNLERQGVDLSIDTDLLYVDVTNGRIGINTNDPTVALEVTGDIKVTNLEITGNIISGNTTVDILDTANIRLDGNTISTTTTNENLNIAPNGSGVISVNSTKIVDLASPSASTDAANKGFVDGLFGDLSITSNAVTSSVGNVVLNDDVDITGNITITGNVVGNLMAGNISILTNTISSINTNGNILLDPNGTGYVKITGTNGFLPPVGSSGDRPVNPVEGLTRYNNSTNLLEFYNGTEWAIAGPNAAAITSQALEGDGSTITFTLDKETSTEGIIVSINGTVQKPTDAYVVSGTQITFQEIPHFGDSIDIRFITITLSFGDTSLPVYTRSQILSMTNVTTGTILYSLDGDSGSPCLAVYDGSNWKKIALTENL